MNVMRAFLLSSFVAFAACSAPDPGLAYDPALPIEGDDRPEKTAPPASDAPDEAAPPSGATPAIVDAGVATKDGGQPPVKPVPPPVPSLVIEVASGLHFSEATIRKPLEDGLRYAVERLVKHVDIGTKKSPTLTLAFEHSNDSYASGYAELTKATIWVPYGYPVAGPNQNYVVNISVHELGHLLAYHLMAAPTNRDLCENEGLATWIAGKYWMNANLTQLASHRAAAQVAIDTTDAYPSMANCVSASDRWYKVYGSFFEYLEQKVPGGILAVSTGKSSASAYSAAWKTWLGY